MRNDLFCIIENIQDSSLLNNCEKVIYFLMEGLNDGQVHSINSIQFIRQIVNYQHTLLQIEDTARFLLVY